MANEAREKLTLPSKRNEAQAAQREHDEITYIPCEGDPARTKWNGYEFKAHIPVNVPRSACVLVPMPIDVIASDGTRTTRHIEKRIPMAELAKGNPTFSVNGETPAKRKMGTARVPTNSDEYRGYCISWVAASTEASAMDARWDAEADLREKCGCEDKDIAYVRPFFEARRLQVAA